MVHTAIMKPLPGPPSPDGAAEQHWLLRNDGEFASEVGEADVTDAHSINLDAATRQLYQAEEGHPQR